MSGSSLSSLIWSVADLLRGDYKPHEYGRVILPFTVLRRLDCVLAPTKEAVLREYAAKVAMGVNPEPFLLRATRLPFYNASPLDMPRLLGDQDNVATNLDAYVAAFPEAVRDIFEQFGFDAQVERLRKAKLLYKVAERFAGLDLGPARVTNHDMGLVFEELIRKFADLSNETAGEHFTPRDAIELMVNLLFIEDDEVLTPGKAVVRAIYDPAAGTGGMLSTAGEFLLQHNERASLTMFGQEVNPESYAICKADMLIKGQDVGNIVLGNTLSEDGHPTRRFDYMLSNPPYGTDWKKVEAEVLKEHKRGSDGRWAVGLPRVSDGQMLFLLHLVSKMRPAGEGGSRIGIVLNGSPLFTGGAGSGESEMRRHLFEHDLVEAIIALPTDMFFNTGISTYVWMLTNRKPEQRRGLVQLIDASALWEKMRRSQGSKRKRMGERHVAMVTRMFSACRPARLATITDADGKVAQVAVMDGEREPDAPAGGTVRSAPFSQLFPNEAFGYRTITVEQPQRDADGKPVLGQKGKVRGKPVPDTGLRDTENVPLLEDVSAYFAREVLPHVPDAWVDEGRTRVGYEVPFSRHFYVHEPPRPLEEIDADLKASTDRIRAMLDGLAA